MEVIIVLLVFVLPLLSIALDKKKKKGVPKVKSKRINWPADKPAAPRPPVSAGLRPTVRPAAEQNPAEQPSDMTLPYPAQASSTTQSAPEPDFASSTLPLPEAAERKTPEARPANALAAASAVMSASRSTRSRSEDAGTEKKKEYSEKQKLIIYSEILKPKFDE